MDRLWYAGTTVLEEARWRLSERPTRAMADQH